jgi:hypothetical protein
MEAKKYINKLEIKGIFFSVYYAVTILLGTGYSYKRSTHIASYDVLRVADC